MRWITANTETMRRYRAEAAGQLSLDSRQPPTRRFFEERAQQLSRSHPTLASKVAEWIRQELILRSSYGTIPKEIPEENSQAIADFVGSPHVQTMRLGRHWTDLNALGANSGFHLDTQGSGDVKRTASFRFHYYHRFANQRRDLHGDVRAYVVLKPDEAKNVAKHFTEMAAALFREGLLFEGKAGTPNLVRIRKDHMVFYIDSIDKDAAQEVLKNYLTKHNVGSDEQMVARQGGVDGLWMAPTPDAQEQQIAGAIEGRHDTVAHHRMAALALSADYMDRLAKAHRRAGNQAEAEAFDTEARRVKGILR